MVARFWHSVAFVVLSSALCVLALSGCSGTGKVTIPVDGSPVTWEYGNPVPRQDRRPPCGTITIDGKLYYVFCDENGHPTHVQPATDRNIWIPVRPYTPDYMQLQNSSSLMIDGETFIMMDTPLQLAFTGLTDSAETLLVEYDLANIGNNANVVELPIEFTYDEQTGVADVRIVMSTELSGRLPSAFNYDLQYETAVVFSEHEGAPGAVFHRAVGPAKIVKQYLQAMGAIDGWVETELGIFNLELDPAGSGVKADGILNEG